MGGAATGDRIMAWVYCLETVIFFYQTQSRITLDNTGTDTLLNYWAGKGLEPFPCVYQKVRKSKTMATDSFTKPNKAQQKSLEGFHQKNVSYFILTEIIKRTSNTFMDMQQLWTNV